MAFSNGYSYRKALTVDHTKVSGGADLSSFPVLVSLTDTALATVANGGKVQSASGFDIRFEDTSGTPLAFEIDQWSGVSGVLIAWVRFPTLSASTNTVVYLYYGNASVVATEANPAGVWDTAYVGVYHLGTASALSGADSTGGGTLLFGSATAAAAGYFGGGALENGSSNTDNHINDRAALRFTRFSFTFWAKLNATQQAWSKILTKGHDASWTLQATRNTTAAVDLRLFSAAGVEAAHAQGPSINDGTWHYVAASYDGATIRVIVDNQAPVTTAYAGAVAVDSTDPLSVAGEYNGSLSSITGTLDEVRLANVARTQGWFNTEYNNQSSPSTFYSVGAEDSGASSTSAGGTLNEAGESVAGATTASDDSSGTLNEAGESASGTTTSNDAANATLNEAGESLSGTATVSAPTTGTLNEAGESLSGFTGAAPDQASGTLNQAGESVTGATTSRVNASGTGTETESLAGVATPTDTGAGAVNEAGESVSGSTTGKDVATGTLSEAGESMHGTATSSRPSLALARGVITSVALVRGVITARALDAGVITLVS